MRTSSPNLKIFDKAMINQNMNMFTFTKEEGNFADLAKIDYLLLILAR
ncbi:unnamed protein product (macronuclear) [Paramecium tetraurelia]|uniref:Uncharacterized protein n=1 Tax=Paramecium tetraurelia TaxID=5888 RepID=A0CBS3_PARTE|nr:uncharacterized protein GSPATT00037023001 [Paramecium tetraurelia]CAK68240.1 unnamed protein product [Paramecium tetraurelia]|eukprot:XP_001435637.1 hypothetical protein (macronuclear) [Paramecium tetraurelia strain d4-2]